MTDYVEVQDAQCQTDDWLYPEKEMEKNKTLTKQPEQGFEEKQKQKEIELRIQNLKLMKVKEIKKENINHTAQLNKLRGVYDKSKNELKDLNDLLVQTIEKQKIVKSKEKPYDPVKEAEFLQKQLNNTYEQKIYYEKENFRLFQMMEDKYSVDNAIQLENKQKELEVNIAILKKECRSLQIDLNDKIRKIENPHWGDIQTKQINSLMDEVSGLKLTLDKNQKKERWNEKNLKHQEEFIIVMQQKYEEVCDQFNLEPGLNFREYCEQKEEEEQERDLDRNLKKQQGNNIIRQIKRTNNDQQVSSYNKTSHTDLKNVPSKVKKDIDENLDNIEEYEASEENIKILFDKLNIQKKNRKTMNKLYKKQISEWNAKLNFLDEELQLAQNTLKEKEKENSIFKTQLEELLKNMKHNSLLPISVQFSTQSQQLDIKQQLKAKQQIRASTKGVLTKFTNEAIMFDDSIKLDNTSKIKRLKFFSIDNVIVGIQTEYRMKGQATTSIINNVPGLSNQEIDTPTEYKDSEYITNACGMVSRWVEYLKFTTNRGFFFEVGDPKNFMKNGVQNIQFDIKKDEKPIAILGVIDKAITKGEVKQYCLQQLSFVLKKKFSTSPRQSKPTQHRVIFAAHKTPQKSQTNVRLQQSLDFTTSFNDKK